MNRTMKFVCSGAMSTIVLLGSLAGGAGASIIEVFPTGSTVDAANLAAALDSAAAGDTIVLHGRDEGDVAHSFNLTSMTSAQFVVSVPNLTITAMTGEVGPLGTAKPVLIGPGSYDADDTMVAFNVLDSADGLMISSLYFSHFEAAVLLQSGAQDVTLLSSTIKDCANGVFGLGDNDNLDVSSSKFRIDQTPTGGNAAVTVQEGSDDVMIRDNDMRGPGVGLTEFVVAGVLDFNLDTASRRLTLLGNKIRSFDVGVYASGTNSRIMHNLARNNGDGMVVISEIATGGHAGTVLAGDVVFRKNRSRTNDDDGIELAGVQCATVLGNKLSDNGGFGLRCAESPGLTGNVEVTAMDNSGGSNCGAGLTVGEPAINTPRDVKPQRP